MAVMTQANIGFESRFKDELFTLLKEPTLEGFREFVRTHTGEQDAIDFKQEWIDDEKLVKLIIAFANSGGGVIFVGIKENKDHSFECLGLDAFVDKTSLYERIEKFIPSGLEFSIYDFDFNCSEYRPLEGKKFQMVTIQDTPERCPFLPLRDFKNLKKNYVYVRRGASCQIANSSDYDRIINRRIDSVYPNEEFGFLSLKEHLNQLKELYSMIDPEKVIYMPSSLSIVLDSIKQFTKGLEVSRSPNPLYPRESFEEYVARLIVEKKKVIERLLRIGYKEM